MAGKGYAWGWLEGAGASKEQKGGRCEFEGVGVLNRARMVMAMAGEKENVSVAVD